ncbi:MAG: hypothetical protein ACYC3S_07185 [Chloroflexota bacterium]
MVEVVSFVSARRAYEYRPDDLRLSLLSTQPVRQKIVAAFSFHLEQVAVPMETFGVVPKTLPPGVVYNFGSVVMDDGAIAPIRFLHFEAQRIVIDVAGPSQVLDVVYAKLLETLDGTSTPDGSPAVGAPTEVHDRSDISVRLGIDSTALMPPPVQAAYDRVIGRLYEGRRYSAVPFIGVHPVSTDEPYPGTPTGYRSYFAFNLDLRKDSPIGERTFFSSAPLDTEAHLGYLQDLEEAVSQSG